MFEVTRQSYNECFTEINFIINNTNVQPFTIYGLGYYSDNVYTTRSLATKLVKSYTSGFLNKTNVVGYATTLPHFHELKGSVGATQNVLWKVLIR